MKAYPLFFPILCACFISACATFEEVAFNEQAQLQLNDLANAKIELNNESPHMALTSLLAIEDVDVLINEALTHNPSLQQTLLTLKMAEQQLTVTYSNQWPSISGGVSTNKTQDNATAYTGSIDATWTLDIWQQLANASEAEQANFAATTYAYQGAKDLLVANIMQAYLALVQFNQLIAIESQRVAVYKTNENIIVDRYRKGLISLNELDTAQSNTQSSQANLVDYQAQYQSSLRNLSLLTGVTKNKISYQVNFPNVIIPLEEIDARNIGRRPDLQQAYQNILSSQYQHKVAYKALLPNLSLTGSLSNTSGNLHEALFGSSAWALLGQLTTPIFNRGKLTSAAEIAKLTAEQSYWAFQEKLLAAVNEVENAIAQEEAITKRLALTKSALMSAKRSEDTYTARYKQGTTSLIDLLQVQQQTFSLQAQVTQLTYEKLNNRILLGLALGLGV